MTRSLQISTALPLPLDTVTSTLIVYGGKNMGKTNLCAVVAEELSTAHLRWAWLDPLGVGWGIRHAADGKGDGHQCLILGGPHGDIPILPDGGAAAADVVVEERVNVLIDYSRKPSGEMWGVGEKIRFVNAYARRLFQRQGDLLNGKRREPLMQLLDEAARYIPQNIPAGNPDLSMCVAAWQQLVEEGRNIGLGVGLFTQRSARINKDVAELADAMFAFRTIGPNSLRAVLDWLGEHVEKKRVHELGEQVRKLDRGTALVVSPGWLGVEKVVPIRYRHTFDSSATPKAGERPRTARGKGAKPDLEAIRVRMAATIEKAKFEDPKELKKIVVERDKKIVDLMKQLAAKPVVVKASKPPKMPKRVEVKVIKDAQIKRLEALDASIGQRIMDLGKAAAAVREAAREAQPAPASNIKSVRQWQVGLHSTPKPAAVPKPVAAPKPARVSSGAEPDGELPEGERKVLICVAQYPDGATKQQIAIMTGYKMRTVNAYVQRLSPSGRKYIEVRGSAVLATQAGIDALGSAYEPLPVGDALREHWLTPDKLPEGERKVFEVVIAAYPESAGREAIGEATSFMPRTVNAYIQRLKARKLVATQGRGQTVASSELFS